MKGELAKLEQFFWERPKVRFPKRGEATDVGTAFEEGSIGCNEDTRRACPSGGVDFVGESASPCRGHLRHPAASTCMLLLGANQRDQILEERV